MRFPKFSELDQEQRAIYSGAPPLDSILVMGPPGTGKTVMAFHRAALLNALSAKDAAAAGKPRVIMFSKVLSTYTAKREGVAEGVQCSTMHSWVWGWYKRFAKAEPPTVPNQQFAHDWSSMLPPLLEHAQNDPAKVHWGHLIVDEGQDFAPHMYQALSMASQVMPPVKGLPPPAVTVFADDNQRLNPGSNSTLEQIEKALALDNGKVYRLRKNYRNSKQIAEFARHYYVGLKSGIPDLPSRAGRSLPRIVMASNLEVVRRRIATFASNNPHFDVGVLCPRDAERRRVFNSVQHRLKDTKIVVQTYSYADRQKHPPEDLLFDKGGSVTVLNFQSAKGLEFDAVFIIDPYPDGAGASDAQARMQLYVMASRAREYLELLLMNPPPDLAERLPSKDFYEQVEE